MQKLGESETLILALCETPSLLRFQCGSEAARTPDVIPERNQGIG